MSWFVAALSSRERSTAGQVLFHPIMENQYDIQLSCNDVRSNGERYLDDSSKEIKKSTRRTGITDD